MQVDTAIATAAADLIRHFNANNTGTLLVTSGSGIGDAANLESGIYFGPGRTGFVVQTARAKLLAVSSHQAADIYLRLLLHYALIKDAVDQKMDFAMVISPLRETALELVHQASQADSATVRRIQNDLIGLQP